MDRPDKAESRRIRAAIGRVLLQDWDPIGINHEPNAQDEYDGYVGEIYELLLRQATEDEISAHLLQIVQERMGLNSNKDQQSRTVEALRKIDIAL